MAGRIKTGDPESRFSQTVLKPALEKFRGVRYKISDRYTKGIPDTVYAYLGHTYWIEAKVVESWDHVITRICMDRLQLQQMFRLTHHTGNRAFYIIQNVNDRKIGLFRIQALKPELRLEQVHMSEDCDSIIIKMIG